MSGTRQPRHRARVWLARVALVLVAIPIVLALAGVTYHAAASALAESRYPLPGRLVDVGGYRLHLYCLGEGSPTVILDAANMGTVSTWAWIQPQLAQTTRVCAYDRAGLGWSDLGPDRQDAQVNTQALHDLLGRATIPGPYVLVGHSLGGLYTRMFAATYPAEVAGMVFIEGTLPDGLKALGLPDVMPNSPSASMMDAAPLLSRFSLLRLFSFVKSDPDLPEPQRGALGAYLASTKWAELIRRQYHVFPTLLAQIRPLYAPGSLGDRPLAVVLGTDGDGGVEALGPLFEQQAALSTNGRIYRVEGANHVSLVDRRAHAEQTLSAILDVVEAVRGK